MGKPSSMGSDVRADSFGKEPDLGMSRSIDQGASGQNNSAFSKPQQTPQMPGFSGQNKQATNGAGSGAVGKRDVELINSKLDTIKAILGSLDQRLANIERNSGVSRNQNNQRQKLW